jgi:hypothetical protein
MNACSHKRALLRLTLLLILCLSLSPYHVHPTSMAPDGWPSSAGYTVALRGAAVEMQSPSPRPVGLSLAIAATSSPGPQAFPRLQIDIDVSSHLGELSDIFRIGVDSSP